MEEQLRCVGLRSAQSLWFRVRGGFVECFGMCYRLLTRIRKQTGLSLNTSVLFGKCNSSEHQPCRRLLEVKENVLLPSGAWTAHCDPVHTRLTCLLILPIVWFFFPNNSSNMFVFSAGKQKQCSYKNLLLQFLMKVWWCGCCNCWWWGGAVIRPLS